MALAHIFCAYRCGLLSHLPIDLCFAKPYQISVKDMINIFSAFAETWSMKCAWTICVLPCWKFMTSPVSTCRCQFSCHGLESIKFVHFYSGLGEGVTQRGTFEPTLWFVSCRFGLAGTSKMFLCSSQHNAKGLFLLQCPLEWCDVHPSHLAKNRLKHDVSPTANTNIQQ